MVMDMSNTATTTRHTITSGGRTIGFANEGRIGFSITTDNGIDLLQHAATLADAEAILMEHRHQVNH